MRLSSLFSSELDIFMLHKKKKSYEYHRTKFKHELKKKSTADCRKADFIIFLITSFLIKAVSKVWLQRKYLIIKKMFQC